VTFAVRPSFSEDGGEVVATAGICFDCVFAFVFFAAAWRSIDTGFFFVRSFPVTDSPLAVVFVRGCD